MKKVSQKQSVVNRELKKVYKEIAEERGRYCTGCGRRDLALSHSHIIPRSRRPDLVTDKRNITYHCLDSIDVNGKSRRGCHTIWEGVERYQLLDYMNNMNYIMNVDLEYYNLIKE
tara:strand:+ start:161 stop:505 length:345 start_codon:yes stop_codon:yes gene_type:complete